MSCAPTTLYRGGGFFDGPELLATMSDPARTERTECRILAEVFPPFETRRPPPASLMVTDPGFAVRVRKHMAELDAGCSKGAASALVCLDAGFLHSNVLYTRSASGVRIVYETFRANDRPYLPQIDPIVTDYAREPMSDSQVLDLFVGSAGTGNYGHWLVDDLPRMAAVSALRAEAGVRPIRIWLSDAGEPMNAVRIASLHRLCAPLGPLEVRIAHLDRVYDFKRLHYVTPISYHPALKSPAAIQWLANQLGPNHANDQIGNDRPGRRLFVTRRPERSRGLLNIDAIQDRLAQLGFQAIEAEGMSFDDQVSIFAQAEVVIGCMGAAMTNVLFAAAGTRVLYLAPQGWLEPFYWDLAAVCGHPYHVIYGEVSTPDRPAHLSSFTIDLEMLEQGLATLRL